MPPGGRGITPENPMTSESGWNTLTWVLSRQMPKALHGSANYRRGLRALRGGGK